MSQPGPRTESAQPPFEMTGLAFCRLPQAAQASRRPTCKLRKADIHGARRQTLTLWGGLVGRNLTRAERRKQRSATAFADIPCEESRLMGPHPHARRDARRVVRAVRTARGACPEQGLPVYSCTGDGHRS